MRPLKDRHVTQTSIIYTAKTLTFTCTRVPLTKNRWTCIFSLMQQWPIHWRSVVDSLDPGSKLSRAPLLGHRLNRLLPQLLQLSNSQIPLYTFSQGDIWIYYTILVLSVPFVGYPRADIWAYHKWISARFGWISARFGWISARFGWISARLTTKFAC